MPMSPDYIAAHQPKSYTWETLNKYEQILKLRQLTKSIVGPDGSEYIAVRWYDTGHTEIVRIVK